MGRYFTIGFFVFVAVMIIVMSIPSFIDWNKYKGGIESAISDASGYEVKVNGPVSFRVLPQPALTLSDVSAFDGSDEAFFTAGNLAGKIALAPLLTGKVRVTALQVTGAHLTTDAERLSDRVETEVSEQQEVRGGKPRGFEGFLVGLVQDVRVDSLLVDDFVVGSRVEGATPLLAVDDGSISFLSLNGPFSTESTVVVNGKRFRLTGNLGELYETRASALSVEGFSGDGTEISFKGTARSLKQAPQFDGSLRVAGQGFAPIFDLLQVLSSSASETAPVTVDLPMTLSGDVSLTPKAMKAPALALQLGDSRLVLDLDLERSDALQGTITARATKIDGDAIAKSLSVQSPSDTGSSTGVIAIDARTEGITYNSKLLHDFALAGNLTGGGFEIASLDVTAPGSTKITLKDGTRQGNNWSAKVRAVSQSAREFLSWSGIDVSEVPAAKLGFAELSADYAQEGDDTALTNMTLKMDGQTFAGHLSLGEGEGSGLAAKIVTSRLDLSDYGIDASGEGLSTWSQKANADLELVVADFTGFGATSKELSAKFKVGNGRAEISRAKLTGPAGDILSFSGRMDDVNAKSYKGELDWKIQNWPACKVTEIAKAEGLLDCGAGDTASLSGHLSLNQGVGSTSVKGSLGNSTVDMRANGVQALWRDGGAVKLKGSAAHNGLELTFDGDVTGIGNAPAYAFKASVVSKNASKLLRNAGFEMGSKVPLTADGQWAWSDSGWRVSGLKGQIGGIHVAGDLSVESDVIGGNLALTHFDFDFLADNGLTVTGADGAWAQSTLDRLIDRDLTGTLEVELEDATLGTLVLPQASLKGVLNKGSSEWALYQGDLWDGAWTGKAIVSRGTHGVRVEARGAGEGMDLAMLTSHVAGEKVIEGRGSLRFVLSGEGQTARGLMRSLSGQIDVESAEGRMRGFDLTGYAVGLGDASGALGVQLANEDHLTHGSSEYSGLLGRFRVSQGKAQTSQWQASTEVGGMHFNLNANLGGQDFKGRAEFNFEGAANLPTFAFAINGWGENLSGSWDTYAMEEIFEAILEAEKAEAAAQAVQDTEANSPAPGEGLTSSGDVESGDLAPLQ